MFNSFGVEIEIGQETLLVIGLTVACEVYSIPSRLKELSIRNYGSAGFPDWFVGDNSLSNVMSLKLSICKCGDNSLLFFQLPSIQPQHVSNVDSNELVNIATTIQLLLKDLLQPVIFCGFFALIS